MKSRLLKPCPFCGKKPDLELGWMDGSYSYQLWCVECGLVMVSNNVEDRGGNIVEKNELISKWNRRVGCNE